MLRYLQSFNCQKRYLSAIFVATNMADKPEISRLSLAMQFADNSTETVHEEYSVCELPVTLSTRMIGMLE